MKSNTVSVIGIVDRIGMLGPEVLPMDTACKGCLGEKVRPFQRTEIVRNWDER